MGRAGDEALQLQEALRRAGDEALQLQEALRRAGDEALQLQGALRRAGDEALQLQEVIRRAGDEALQLQEAMGRLPDADLAWPDRDCPRCRRRSGLPRWLGPPGACDPGRAGRGHAASGCAMWETETKITSASPELRNVLGGHSGSQGFSLGEILILRVDPEKDRFCACTLATPGLEKTRQRRAGGPRPWWSRGWLVQEEQRGRPLHRQWRDQ